MSLDEVRDWLKRNERSIAWLARKAGYSRHHIWYVLNERVPFEGEVRRRVSEAIRNWNSSTA